MFSNLLFKFDYFSTKEIFGKYSVPELIDIVSDSDLLSNILSMVHHLDNIRGLYGSPIRLTSSYRNSEHNTRVGGSKTSQHKLGLALDIQPYCKNGIPSQFEMESLLKCICQYQELNYCFGQLIYHHNYIHIGAQTADSPSTCYFHIILKSDISESLLFDLDSRFTVKL